MNGKETENIQSLKQFYGADRPDAYTLEDLRNILRILRSDEGCPWDRKQTFETMVPCVLEEAGEVAEAVRNQDTENLCEELGDLLFQVVFCCQMAEEQGLFTFEDAVDGISRKMVRRHPKIFGGDLPETDGNEGDLWERIKQAEKAKNHRTNA